ncbi:NUDIX hydrolase domain-like [Trema orientale]|uniref:NUDIX hydrolase domain-like n=1 Tax=Trema orientale TaxID=63057 RepID=A0A2P5F8W5_TREOI|nr:NUDIX hydrolase domain-like [Trema orientale]
MTTATMNTLVHAGSSKISKLRNWWLAPWRFRIPSKNEEESIFRALVQGGEVKETWSQSFCWVHLSEYKGYEFSSWILYLYDRLNREDFEITTIILRFLWCQRNNHLVGNHI